MSHFRNIIIILVIVFLGLILINKVVSFIPQVLGMIINLVFIVVVILAIVYLVKKLRS